MQIVAHSRSPSIRTLLYTHTTTGRKRENSCLSSPREARDSSGYVKPKESNPCLQVVVARLYLEPVGINL